MGTPYFPAVFQPFFRVLSGGAVNRATYDPQSSTQDAITALAGGQTAAPVLVASFNHVTVCATGAGVSLPKLIVGQMRSIRNDGAQALTVYGNSADSATINGTAAATGVSLAAAANISFAAIAPGKWITI